MSMFDSVKVYDAWAVCSEGHSLVDEEFQTKCFERSLDRLTIRDEVLSEGDQFALDGKSFTGFINIYCTCRKCPAFVQAKTHNLMDVWIEFTIELRESRVVEVKRVSKSTADWLKEEPTKPWMKDGFAGPMSYEKAYAMHVGRIALDLKK
jgi:hypothetical protein